ncbi:MAG: transketolase [Gemmatimonadetes bacterium]|nr:transketolase [Gemmatimonadota bacterium]|tara:strand:- start:1165 stop:2124 length:960 start_codon:yes stop_codon:yes gene_type:complete
MKTLHLPLTLGDTLKAQRDAFGDTLVELIDQDERVYVLDGDLANSTKADKVSRERPARFLQMGIAEQNMMGVAAGMASCGLIPWLSSFACFLVNRDLDQLRVVVAQPNLPVKIAGAYSGLLTGKTGKTHQEVSDLSVMRAMPNMTVISPADAVEVRAAMIATNDSDGPVYIRMTRDPETVAFPDDYTFEIGRTIVVREGSDVTIFSTGAQTMRCLQAADLLAANGISAHVVHVPTIKPLDAEGIAEAAARTGRVVTAEDHTIIGGLGGAVAEALGELQPTPMRRVGIRDTFGESAANEDLLAKYGITPEHVADAARALL